MKGMLTPARKLNRRKIVAKYHHEIEVVALKYTNSNSISMVIPRAGPRSPIFNQSIGLCQCLLYLSIQVVMEFAGKNSGVRASIYVFRTNHISCLTYGNPSSTHILEFYLGNTQQNNINSSLEVHFSIGDIIIGGPIIRNIQTQ